ncbi:mitochondrial cytochrome b2-like protein [Periconia macrospinosa]|uniref:L-lactate dehydrogenase (cytochrome) n=1 Tax=Periconia macrospinosa TaxID=97972 RepID=A0A2V1DXA6_9PLEO|nr:mitochondrial cytochrome b2-like protein [Periconia macrospinosa]
MLRKVPMSEVSQHNHDENIWLVISGKIYDFTRFMPEHPGGADVIRRYAGRDATKVYGEVHSPNLVQMTLHPSEVIGEIDDSTITFDAHQSTATKTTSSTQAEMPSLDNIINLYDLEDVASKHLSQKAWAYINGASNDNITRDENQALMRRIWFRPSVMRDVSSVGTRAKLLGTDLECPIFICPTGAVRMAGNEGEIALAKAAATMGIIQCIATASSYPLEEILDATPERAFFQLYVNKDRQKSEALIKQINESGKVRALFITVDVPVISKREADERVKPDVVIDTANIKTHKGGSDKKGAGMTRQNSGFIDSALSWNDIEWLRGHTKLPIVVKGIQSWRDAKMAVQYGCQGIVVSNHGGRAADTAQPAILTLLELQKNCPEVFSALEVLIDGGFRRGSDVVKAICLGASGVGIGRPMLYAVQYGQVGVEHAIQILREEIETAMQLCGMTDLIRDSSPDYVNTCQIDHLVPSKRHSYLRKIERFQTKL